MLCRPTRFARPRAGQETDGDARTTSREGLVASTAASSATSPTKFQQDSPTFSMSRWQSMASKWHVSTESRLKTSEEKLSSSQSISRRHADQISKIKTEIDTVVTATDVTGREAQTLVETLVQVKHELDALSHHIRVAEKDLTAQSSLKDHFHSLNLELSHTHEDMQTEFKGLSLLHSEKLGMVESKARTKKEQVDCLRGSLNSGDQELHNKYDKLVLDHKEAIGRIETIGQEVLNKEKTSESLHENVLILEGDHQKASVGLDSVQAKLRLMNDDFVKEFEKLNEEELRTVDCLQQGHKEEESLDLEERQVTNLVETLEDESLDIKDCLGHEEDTLMELLSKEKCLNEEITAAKRDGDLLLLDLQEIDKTNEKISNLKATLETSEEECLAVAKKVEYLSVIENLKGQLDEKNVKLCQDIYSLEAAVSAKMIEIAEIKDQVKSKDLESEGNGQTLAVLIKQEQTSSQELAQVKASLDQVVAASAQMSEKIRSAETCLNEEASLPQDQSRLEEATKTLDDLKKESVQLNLLIEERTKTFEEIAKQVEELKASITSKRGLIEEMTHRFQTASDQDTSNQVSDKVLKDKLKTLESWLKRLEKEEKTLGKEADGLDREKEELEKILEKTEEATKVKEEDCTKSEAAVTALKESLAELESRESNAKAAAERLKKKLEVKKNLEKGLSKEKKTLIGANKNKEKMAKQFEKSTKDKRLIESSKDEQKKNLEEVLNSKETLTLQLSNVEDLLEKSIKASQSQGDGKKNLKLVESVLKKFEKEKANVQNELKCKVQEYNGILACRDNDHNDSFKRLTNDVEEAKAREESLSHQLQDTLEELKRIEEVDVVDNKLQALEEKRLSLKELQSHLKEREQEGSKLLAKIDSLKQTDSPAPGSKFFKTPRNLSIYRSPITPSPRKKLAKDSKTSWGGGKGDDQASDIIVPSTTRRSSFKMASSPSGRQVSASPMRSFLGPPRKSPVKSSRLAQVSSVSRARQSPNLDLMSMSDSSQ